MLIWEGSAVRVEEAFPDLEEQEESDHAQALTPRGIQKHIPATPGYNSTGTIQTTDSARVRSRCRGWRFEMVVETEKAVPAGTVVVVTLQSQASLVVPRSSAGNRRGSITGSNCVCWILTLCEF